LRCYNLNEVYPKIDSNHVLFFLCLGVYITPSDTLFWTDLQKVNFLDFLLHYYMLDVGQSKAAIVHNVVASIELYVWFFVQQVHPCTSIYKPFFWKATCS